MRRYFIITIDTEGDNQWAVKDIHAHTATENAKYLERFQLLCERYGFVVTYLTNYEMARDKIFVDMGKIGLARGSVEIGMHEHSWNSPPFFPLLKSPVNRGKPYITEYPTIVIEKKLDYLTKLLQDQFQSEITSHRGGRWSFDQRVAKMLCRLGYVADCTCTPGISWKNQPGWSWMSKGTDWKNWKCVPDIICDCNGNKLVEVPATVVNRKEGLNPAWFRPNGKNGEALVRMLDYLYDENYEYIEFMIHSSELMPGGSPTFRYKSQIEDLYVDLDNLFQEIRKKGFEGISLSDYARLKI